MWMIGVFGAGRCRGGGLVGSVAGLVFTYVFVNVAHCLAYLVSKGKIFLCIRLASVMCYI